MNTSNNVITSIKSIISLVLYIVHKARMLEDQNENCTSLIKNIKRKVEVMLKEWIVLGDVIGGSIFGYSVKYNGSIPIELKKEDQELKVNDIFWTVAFFNFNSYGRRLYL